MYIKCYYINEVYNTTANNKLAYGLAYAHRVHGDHITSKLDTF